MSVRKPSLLTLHILYRSNFRNPYTRSHCFNHCFRKSIHLLWCICPNLMHLEVWAWKVTEWILQLVKPDWYIFFSIFQAHRKHHQNLHLLLTFMLILACIIGIYIFVQAEYLTLSSDNGYTMLIKILVLLQLYAFYDNSQNVLLLKFFSSFQQKDVSLILLIFGYLFELKLIIEFEIGFLRRLIDSPSVNSLFMKSSFLKFLQQVPWRLNSKLCYPLVDYTIFCC